MRPRALIGSVATHAAGLLALVWLGSLAAPPPSRPAVLVDLVAPPPLTLPRPMAESRGGGSSGGNRSPLPVAEGRSPRTAVRQFALPPQQVRHNENPVIELPPAVDVAESVPDPPIPRWGQPLAPPGPPSNGTGTRGSMGNRRGTGGNGDGDGRGAGPGVGPGVFRIGGSVTGPQLVFSVEPEYSEEARKAKFQGTVVLSVVVEPDGTARRIRVVGTAGLGLEEKAIEAVKQWRFRPGTRNGRPVPVLSTIEVNFRLL